MLDTTKKAIITRLALEKKEVNWVLRDEPNNPQDSGWQLFYGNEDDAYLDDPSNAAIISLEAALSFSPQLAQVLSSQGKAFDWSEEKKMYVENTIYNDKDAIMEQARKDQLEYDRRHHINQNTGVTKKWWEFWK
jgi:hypothetical protein